MSNKYLFKTLIELYDYIQNYKINKQSGTAQSMGTVFVAEDKKFFYDSGTSKVILIDEGIFKLIRYLITYNKTLSEINVLIKENNINTDRFLDFINAENLLKGFNITSLHCDTFLRHVHSSINTGTTQIILELTEECNLRCQYCIYNENYKNNRNFGLKRMSKETAFKAIDFLVENGDKSEISITFYGGEPLLEFQLLKEVIEYSKLVMPERRKHFSFTTNLTLLTEEMANYFSTVENLSILCSIDGPKEIHDEHRKYRNGTGTFDNVYDNFKMLNTICKSNDTMSIAVNAVYAPPYYKEKPEIIDRFFKNLDFVKHNFNYHLGYPSKGSLPKHIFESMPKGDTSLLNWQDKELLGNSSFASFKETTAISSLEKIHNRIITNYQSDIVPQNGCCVAGYRRLYVTTTGKFLACERIGNSPILGDVDRGIDLDVVYSKYIFDYSNKWLKYCNDCWSAKICSTCFVDKMDVDGVKDPDIDECNIVRFLNIKNLSRYHYLLQKYPYKLLYLESADFMGY